MGTSASALAYYDTSLVLTRNFLVHFVCGDSLNCTFVNNVAVNNLVPELNTIAIYPNPAENNFAVNLTQILGTDFTLEVYDSQGKLMLNKTGLGNELVNVNTENFAPGIYFVKVNAEGRMYLMKEIIGQ